MPKLPEIKPAQIAKVLRQIGFVARSGKGSHTVFKHPDGRRTVVANHRRAVRVGTLRAILRQAKLSVGEFLDLLKS